MLKSTLRNAAKTGLAIAIASLLSQPNFAQWPVVQFTANYVPVASSIGSYSAYPTNPGTFATCNSYNYTYTWSNGTNNHLKLVGFTANSKSYVLSGVTNVLVKLRRVNNAVVTGNRNILYIESTFATATSCVSPTRQLDFKAPYSDDMTTFLNNNVLNHGTDNIFANASNGDGNNNNIERVDVIFPTGISSGLPSEMGFILCERGNNNAHDGFRIAAILSKNASNDPTSFGAVKSCVAGNGSNNGSWGHPSTTNGNRQLAAYILRKDAAEPYLRVSSNVNQELGGVFFSLSDLGVAANQIIYGYSLIGPDGTSNPTSAQLLNTSDASVYPTNTTEAAGGGLDLIAVNTFFGTNQALTGSLITKFNGTVVRSNTYLNWSLNNLAIGSKITLERADNTGIYLPIKTYTYNGFSSAEFIDQPGKGTFNYRLEVKTPMGLKANSDIIHLKINQALNNTRLFPTLVKAGASFTLENIADGTYTASLRTATGGSTGRVVFTVRNGKGLIYLPKQLSPGAYYFVIEKDGSPLYDRKKIMVIQ